MLPSGQEPLWISVEELNIDELRPFLELQTKGYEGETIVISRLNLPIYKDLCQKMNWKFARVKDIIGTECKCLITFGISSHQNFEFTACLSECPHRLRLLAYHTEIAAE